MFAPIEDGNHGQWVQAVAAMHTVFWICAGVSALFLLAEMRDGGWRRIVPVLVWLGATLPIAAALPTTAERVVALAVAFAGVFALRELVERRLG
jgi:hypothetical protein